ncbi:MAG: hypothetical protein ACT452_04400 [Microthrixaceae bacterium]
MSERAPEMTILAKAVLPPLAAIAGLAFGFGILGSALLTNIHVDGHSDATTMSTLLAALPFTATFFAPGFVVVLAARLVGAELAQRTFGVTAVVVMAFLTGGYALVTIIAVLTLWAGSRLIRSRSLSWPPLDIATILTGPAMFWFFAYAEANR